MEWVMGQVSNHMRGGEGAVMCIVLEGWMEAV